MKTEIFHSQYAGRVNPVKKMIYNFFISISSLPKLVLEVFLRRLMGYRYFSLFWAIIAALLLVAVPIPFIKFAYDSTTTQLIFRYGTWYIFTILFIWQSIMRRRESPPEKSKFDFKRYSKSTGNYFEEFTRINYRGRLANVRQIETILEPGFCLIIALILLILSQAIGYVIGCCALIYWLSKKAEYDLGDDYMRNIIDDIIAQKSVHSGLIEGLDISKQTGHRIMSDIPEDQTMREHIYSAFEADGFK